MPFVCFSQYYKDNVQIIRIFVFFTANIILDDIIQNKTTTNNTTNKQTKIQKIQK